MTRLLLPVLSAALLAGCPDYVASERSLHGACFDLMGPAHRDVACSACHTTLPPGDLSAGTPTCDSGTADCIRCHACAGHTVVSGFACANTRCYECHRFAAGVGP